MGVVGGKVVLDLDYAADSTADVDMNVVMTGSGRFVEIQGAAEGAPFSSSDLNRMLLAARRGTRQIFALQKRILKIHVP